MALLDRFVREKGITVIQVSHDMEQVAEYCSRVVVLDQGHIIFDGTPEGLFMQEALMRESKLDAPPVAALSQRLWPDARRVPITVNEFLEEEYDHAPARV
jgi:energy-coupling factor transport system ATP-binding protein